MHSEPRTEFHYIIEFFDRSKKKWMRTRYTMSEETAAQHYGDTEWHVIPQSKVERKTGGDPLRLSMSRFQRKS